ncbi:MAG: phosphotransferase [Methylovulum sp.]|uniref:aminoglycoside phosphotransferase family protein n=1 Tax=Methylovulum sp. TaxID=1916980 RepID=UPI002639FBCD|nr:phosphotransferase [Methylovulum sp.]MDD2722721.1 phosphotransferase [Methylovulum sp.]MDD5123981.1 phosphotransferase [Methylovulum sp.]
MSEDFRTLALLDWLENDLLLTVESFQPASSDASFRRYFRVATPDATMIVMDAPPDKENLPAFIKAANILAGAGVKSPGIFQQNLDDGFLLLEDFGSQPFLDAVAHSNADYLYQLAMDSLFNLQSRADTQTCALPRYDEALLKRELGIFSDWFVSELLDLELSEALVDSVETLLINSALAQPVTFVHRDYHSRNLMLVDDNTLGVLDFQDAVVGPITYDLVSLLRDCYIAWPQPQIEHWLAQYFQRLQAAGLVSGDLRQFSRWFDLMGLQRHLKAIGIFSRLHLRDGKSGYLQDIPRTLDYVQAITATYPELAEFDRFIRQQAQPAYHRFLQTVAVQP